MKKTSSASKTNTRTTDQEQAFRRLVEDMLKHVTTVTLDKVPGNREGWQRVLGKGDVLKQKVTAAVIEQVTAFCDLPLRCLERVTAPAAEALVLPKDPEELKKLLKDRCNIGWVGDNATSLVAGKTLPAVKAETLAVHQLAKWQTGHQLKEERGASGLEMISLMLALVALQKDGPKSPPGKLLTNGYGNVFIVEIEGVAWTFCVDWYGSSGCWDFGAVELDDGWSDDSRLFSRDSANLALEN